MNRPLRPSAADTEEDLLRLQKELLSGRAAPAARVVKCNTTARLERDVVSGFSAEEIAHSHLSPPKRPKKSSARGREQHEEDDVAALLDEQDKKHVTGVLASIQERDTRSATFSLPAVPRQAFPSVLSLDHKSQTSRAVAAKRGGKKQSLFARQFIKSGRVAFGLPEDESLVHQSAALSNRSACFAESQLISGAGLRGSGTGSESAAEVRQIHEENVKKLADLSEEEILAERNRLMENLDPSLLAFIKNRTKYSSPQQPSDQQVSLPLPLTVDSATDVPMETDTSVNGAAKDLGAVGGQKQSSQKRVQFAGVVEREKEAPEVNLPPELADASKHWLHMDNVEPEKMAWMKELPDDTKKRERLEKACPARFDFTGCVIHRTEEQPSHLGLHHHGDEPEAAGYTLSELCLLARSSVPQQQLIAFQTLSAIFLRAHAGCFSSELDGDVVARLLDAGVLMLLRWALDDRREAIFSVAVQALHALLMSEHDQISTQQAALNCRNCFSPCLAPLKKDDVPPDEKEESSDEQLLAEDVIKGLVKMNLLPRLRYLLEVCHLSPPTVLQVLGILSRCCEHSVEVATQVANCPRLLDFICSAFVPVAWPQKAGQSNTMVTDVYGYPVPHAVSLFAHLCQAGRHLASKLTAKFELTARIGRYLTVESRELQLPLLEAHRLQQSALHLWRVLTCYALDGDFYRAMQSVVLDRLQKTTQSASSQSSAHQSEIIQTVAQSSPDCNTAVWSSEEWPAAVEAAELCSMASLLRLLDSAVYVAASTRADVAEWQKELKLAKSIHASTLGERARNAVDEALCQFPEVSLVDLAPAQVQSWMSYIRQLIPHWLQRLLGSSAASEELTSAQYTVVGAALDFASSFLSKLGPRFTSAVDIITEAEECFVFVECLLTNGRLMDAVSRIFQLLLAAASSFVDNLPHRGCVLVDANRAELSALSVSGGFGGCLMSAAGCVQAVVCMAERLLRMHKGLSAKVASLLESEVLLKTVATLSTVTHPTQIRHPLHRVKILCAASLARLAIMVVNAAALTTPSPYHGLALSAVCQLLPGDEAVVKDLMSSVVFHEPFFREVAQVENVMATLGSLSVADSRQSASTVSGSGKRQVISEACQNLSSIRATFMASVGSQARVQLAIWSSRVRHLGQPYLLDSLLWPPADAPLLPVDWMFVPIVEKHNQATQPGQLYSELDVAPDNVVADVTRTLQYVVLLEESRPEIMANLGTAVRFARLLCVFLMGANLFLHADIGRCLSVLLHRYTQPPNPVALAVGTPIPGVASFYDLYLALVTQYDAVSYGDDLFASFVLVAAQRHHDVPLRRLLWGEHESVLQTITLSVDKAPGSVDSFLHPVEEDTALLQLYMKAVASGVVRPQRSPLLYLIAVHHICHFVFSVKREEEKPANSTVHHTMLACLLSVQTENVFRDVVHYDKPCLSERAGFSLFSSPPSDRIVCLAQAVFREGLDSPLARTVSKRHPQVMAALPS